LGIHLPYRDCEHYPVAHPRELSVAHECDAVLQEDPEERHRVHRTDLGAGRFFFGPILELCGRRSRRDENQAEHASAPKNSALQARNESPVEKMWKNRGSPVDEPTASIYFGQFIDGMTGYALC
jgi:hypothetical protein